MPATDPTGVVYPVVDDAFDQPGDSSRTVASLRGKIVVPVPNVTGRSAVVAALAAAGTPVAASRPLIDYRADATAGRRIEVSEDGTAYRYIVTSAVDAAGDYAITLETGYGTLSGWTTPRAEVGPDGYVDLRGVSTRTAAGASAASFLIGTLATSARPAVKRGAAVATSAGPAWVEIGTDGTVTCKYLTSTSIPTGWWVIWDGIRVRLADS